jgi:hypothetical protein
MAKRPIELVLESTLREVEDRERRPVFDRDLIEALLRHRRLLMIRSLALAVVKFNPLMLVSEWLLGANLSIVESVESLRQAVSELWHRFLFGWNYDAPYRAGHGPRGSRRRLTPSGQFFSPELIAALEKNELLLETGKGLSVRSASALFREGL